MFSAESLVLALESLLSAQEIDRTMLRGGHEPGTRVVRDARLRPLLERGDESILCESSARLTSRTIRVRPAKSLANSILQTASIERWVSESVTATDHTIINPQVQAEASRDYVARRSAS